MPRNRHTRSRGSAGITKREFMRMSAAASGWGLAARSGSAARSDSEVNP